MATIGVHIDVIQTDIKKLGDDTKYSSPYLYEVMKAARSFLVSRRLKSGSKVSSSSFQTVCLPLSSSTFFDCSCVPNNDCVVQKSNCTIPAVMVGRNVENLTVTTLLGERIDRVSPKKLKAKTQSNLQKPYYTIINNSLYLFNSNLAIVLITGLFQDPSQLDGFCNCNASDSTTDPNMCYTIENDDFPIDEDLVLAMRDEVVRRVAISQRFPEDDKLNDMNDNE